MESSILLFISLLTVVSCQVNFPGKCNNVTTQQNFDIKKYTGIWYEIEKYHTMFEPIASCVQTKYAPGKNNTYMVENYMNLVGHNVSYHGTMYEKNSTLKDGKLVTDYPDINQYKREMWVLSTDYTNYAIVWNCSESNNTNSSNQFAWVLARTPNITNSLRMQIHTILVQNNLDLNRFEMVNQTHCKRPRNSSSTLHVSFGLVVSMLIVSFLKK